MTPRIAILADYLEEGWTSMDHYAAMLMQHLGNDRRFESVLVRPTFHHRMGRMPWLFGPRHGRTLDRYINRYLEYPRAAARRSDVDLFHVVDQTYAHVATRLPAKLTVVTCHDLDFADPPPGTRKAWLVRTTGATALRGLRTAARVICDSDAIRAEILRRGLVEPHRLSVIPLGVEEVFGPDGPPALSPETEALLARAGSGPMILHVGAMVPRKRLDLLLRAFTLLRRDLAGATLVRVGGPLAPAMRALAEQLGIASAIVEMPFLSRAELAATYRRADVFLLCSETEGFALPVLEAMACGLPVVARELPAVREVAGDAIRHVPGADPAAFAAAVAALLRDRNLHGSLRRRGLDRAATFRWGRTAEMTAQVYQEVLGEQRDP
ncbi:MAG TPA: glycosyltransferase family 1 protein [Methylomirabilota bacterium]|nr:glycosyltransferase family 1 protein [Methylomirabilota bacterium]